ncbi:RNA-directed DNA polymerase [Microbacterium foliorum]
MSASDLSAEEVRHALLDFNYLPRSSRRGDDLPPSFTSAGLSEVSKSIVDRYVARHKHTREAERNRYQGYSVVDGRVAHYRLNPRKIEVPHPVAYSYLVETISRHWQTELHPRLSSSASQFEIRKHPDGRIATMQTSRPHLRPGVGSRFRVRTDITSFYDAIYTHAIPWAMLGKTAAKADHSTSIPANAIDAALRFSRRGETTGISTGPGTSLVIAEVLLGAIDSRLSEFRYERFLDDYIAYTRSESEAEDFINVLEVELRSFGLSLNARKTIIEELPQPDEPSWIRELRRESPQNPNGLLDHAVDLSKADPKASAIRWVLSRITRESSTYSAEETSRLVRRMAELSYTHPYTTSALIQLLESRDLSLPGDELDVLLKRHVATSQTSAVCWLLHHAWSRQLHVSNDSWRRILASRDPLPAAFLIAMPDTDHSLVRDLVWAMRDAPDPYARDENWVARYVAYSSGHSNLADNGFEEMLLGGVKLLEDPRGTWTQEDWGPVSTSDDEDDIFELGLSG